MNKVKELWNRLKQIKHFEIYLAVLVGIVVCVIYFSFFGGGSTDNNNNNSTENPTTAQEYVDMLENKLVNVLSKISGAGKCEVIITLESGFSYEYATDSETQTTTSGGTETTIKTETIILVSGEPVIIKENYPEIKGVVVVAEGAKDFSVLMNIQSAIETALEVEASDITILS